MGVAAEILALIGWGIIAGFLATVVLANNVPKDPAAEVEDGSTVVRLLGAGCFLAALGVLFWVFPLTIGGYLQGANGYSLDASLNSLRISTLGLGLILLGNLLFALNVLALFVTWKINLVKTIFVAVTAPLKTTEVKS